MLTTLLVLQIIVAVALVIVILLQKNASDGLAGLSGGGGNSGDSLLSGRASANLLTRTTTILATIFLCNSLLMATIISRGDTYAERITAREDIAESLSTISSEEGQETGTEGEAQEAAPIIPIAE